VILLGYDDGEGARLPEQLPRQEHQVGVAPKTVQRRLDWSLQLLTKRLGDLGPS
jgi:hypothetical protein